MEQLQKALKSFLDLHYMAQIGIVVAVGVIGAFLTTPGGNEAAPTATRQPSAPVNAQTQGRTGGQQPVADNTGGGARSGSSFGAGAPPATFNQTFAGQLMDTVSQRLAEQERKAEGDKAVMRGQLEELAKATQAQLREISTVLQAMQQAPAAQQAQAAPVSKIRPPGGQPVASAAADPSVGRPVGAESAAAPPVSGAPGQPSAAPAAMPVPTPPVVLASAKPRPVIAAQGFVRARLLNGVIATASDQKVVLARIEGQYISAGGHRTNLDGCIVSIQATADLSSGRLEGKPAQLSCTWSGNSNNWPVSGYVVDDADGIRGVRAVLVDPTPKRVALEAAAGGLSGIGGVVRQAETRVPNSGATGDGASIISANRAVAGAALQGAGQAAGAALQDYYSQYRPTLQVAAQTRISMVLLSELALPAEASNLTRVRSTQPQTQMNGADAPSSN